MKILCVIGIFVMIATSATAFEDVNMTERFQFWFHSLDINDDGVLSENDTTDCYPRYSAGVDPDDSQALARIHVKCKTAYPMWFESFILRGNKNLDEDEFVEQFTDLKNSTSTSKFRRLIRITTRFAYNILDINNDGMIDSNEDLCATEPYPRREFADQYSDYLLYGPMGEPSDTLCPFLT